MYTATRWLEYGRCKRGVATPQGILSRTRQITVAKLWRWRATRLRGKEKSRGFCEATHDSNPNQFRRLLAARRWGSSGILSLKSTRPTKRNNPVSRYRGCRAVKGPSVLGKSTIRGRGDEYVVTVPPSSLTLLFIATARCQAGPEVFLVKGFWEARGIKPLTRHIFLS